MNGHCNESQLAARRNCNESQLAARRNCNESQLAAVGEAGPPAASIAGSRHHLGTFIYLLVGKAKLKLN